jgi:hypothetical protein
MLGAAGHVTARRTVEEDKMNASQRLHLGSTPPARLVLEIAILGTVILLLAGSAASAQGNDALIKDALSAAPPMIAKTAMVKDWNGTMLREGSDEYVCLPTHPDKRAKGEKEPMCLDKVWLAWGDAWMNKKPFKAENVGIAYMLAGDTGASNTDPYAATQTHDNHWIAERPHVMVLLPDPAQLDALPTDPSKGAAYVMWKGTPYAHIMVPVGERPKASQ